MTEVNQDPGPRITQSASRTAATVSWGRGRVRGFAGDACTVPLVDRHLAPADCVTASGSASSWPRPGRDLQGDAGHGQDPTMRVEESADEVEPDDGVAVQVPQGRR